jgi:triphosphatase
MTDGAALVRGTVTEVESDGKVMAPNRSKEYELKFELEPAAVPEIKVHPILASAKGGCETQNQKSVYFDTDKLDLRKAGVSLRVRQVGELRIQTVKSDSDGTVFDRNEFEQSIATDHPDLAGLENTPVAAILTARMRRALRPLFRTEIERSIFIHAENGSEIEIALDRGRVAAKRRSQPICELELELKHGEPRDLYRLARRIGRSVPLRLSTISKQARGYALLEGRSAPEAVKAEPVRLKKRTRGARAFTLIANACLRQVLENASATLDDDTEALHQMRVGIRRLRTAISLFGVMIDDKQRDHIKRELKWAAGQLSQARDLDVFIVDLRGHTDGKGGSLREFEKLQQVLQRRRVEAYQEASEAIQSPRFRTLMLEVAAWIETGDWREADDNKARKLRRQRVRRFAAKELSRGLKRILKTGGGLEELDVGKRHKLRIAGKKLRYAIEFFAELFPARTTRKRAGKLVKILKALQDGLGTLNDFETRKELTRDVSRFGLDVAFASGMVRGSEATTTPNLIKSAEAALVRLKNARPFWT